MATKETDSADVPPDPTSESKVEHPTKGRRFRLFKGGDVLVLRIVGEGDKTLPAGSLLPIEGVPQFEDMTSAKAWVKNDSGDLLQGMVIMIVWAKAKMDIAVQNKPTVVITETPRFQVTGPEVA